jgi:hypothetical protein
MKLKNPISRYWTARICNVKNLKAALYFMLIGIVSVLLLPFLTYILLICFVSYLFIKIIGYIPKTSLKRF